MPSRSKRLFGSLLLLAFVFFYLWLAADVGAALLDRLSGAARIAYFAIAGIAWVIPAGAIVWWTYRAPREP